MAAEKENLDIMINKIQEKLGIQIDKNSFDYEFLNVLNQLYSYIDSKNFDFLNAHTFENLKDNNLDNFLNYFNLYRIKGNNNDTYEFELLFNSTQANISINEKTIFKYKDEYYMNIKKTIINNEKNVLYAQKVFSNQEINEPVFSIDGIVIFNKNAIEISDSSLDVSYELPKKLKLISFKISPNETESDLSFMERSKSILQNFGYSNLKKIEYLLMRDTRIKSIYTSDNNGYSNIIIFPNDLSELDDIIKYSSYVVDYFKSSKINIIKPNVVEININGLNSQLFFRDDYENIVELFRNAINDTLGLLKVDSNNNFILSKNDLIYSLKHAISGYIDNQIKIDYEALDFIVKYYFRTNYKVPIMIETIYDNKIIENTDVITLGIIE